VTRELRESGIAVVDCDVIAREVVEPGRPAFRAIIKAFGSGVAKEDGSGLDRQKLGDIVFKDAAERRKLTAITGPAIFKEIAKQVAWCFCKGTPIVVIDAPTLYESKHLLHVCSKVIVVSTTEEEQVRRIVKRDGLSEEQARDRIGAQLPLADKVKRADIVIPNEGSLEELRSATKAVIASLKENYCYGFSVLMCLPAFAAFALCLAAGVAVHHGWS